MMLHLVLFKPRPDLDPAERRHFNDVLEAALGSIPSIRRYRLGRRTTHGAAYEAMTTIDFEYLCLLEFDDLAGLRGYLDHPSHAELGSLFYSCSEAALAYDYDIAGSVADLVSAQH